jgi:hypothetical protein
VHNLINCLIIQSNACLFLVLIKGTLLTARKIGDSVSVEDQFLAAANVTYEIYDSSKSIDAAASGAKTTAASLRECPQCSKSFKLVPSLLPLCVSKPFTIKCIEILYQEAI